MYGGNSISVTASPSPARPRSTPSTAFTQVEERSLVPPAIAEKPANLSALAHFQQRRNAAANRSSGTINQSILLKAKLFIFFMIPLVGGGRGVCKGEGKIRNVPFYRKEFVMVLKK